MEYSEELLTQIVQAGTLGYPLSKIMNIFDIKDDAKFKADFYDEKSVLWKSYKKGIDKSDFILDSKLFEIAKSGDLKAIEKYNLMKRNNLHDYNKEKNK